MNYCSFYGKVSLIFDFVVERSYNLVIMQCLFNLNNRELLNATESRSHLACHRVFKLTLSCATESYFTLSTFHLPHVSLEDFCPIKWNRTFAASNSNISFLALSPRLYLCQCAFVCIVSFNFAFVYKYVCTYIWAHEYTCTYTSSYNSCSPK